MASKDPAADARKAQAEAAQAQARAEQASAAALEQSAIDLTTTSSDAQFSTGEPNPDQNPLGLNPPPGPSYIEYRGVAKEAKS
jgi:hypothetical protein